MNPGRFNRGRGEAALDAWVEHYNTKRPHQSLGMAPPLERLRLAASGPQAAAPVQDHPPTLQAKSDRRPSGVGRCVDQRGRISLAGRSYRAGATFAGEPVGVVCQHGLVEIAHAGVLVATHAERKRPTAAGARRLGPPPCGSLARRPKGRLWYGWPTPAAA